MNSDDEAFLDSLRAIAEDLRRANMLKAIELKQRMNIPVHLVDIEKAMGHEGGCR